METNRIIIRNLDSLATPESIENLLSTYGDVGSIRINRGKGTGVVEMTSVSEALRVCNKLDGSVLWGRTMEINIMNDSLRHRFRYLFSKYLG